jgi:hypothetical protein
MFPFAAVNTTACGDEKTVAQMFVLNRIGCCKKVARRALECAPFLVLSIRLLHTKRLPLSVNGCGINSELYERDHGMAEQRVQAKEQLAADGFELLLPGRIGDSDDERFSIQAKGHGLPAKSLARDPPPGNHGCGFGHRFRLASRAQEFRQCTNQIIHGQFAILDFRF